MNPRSAAGLRVLPALAMLLLCAACTGPLRRPAPTPGPAPAPSAPSTPPPRSDAALEARCRAVETAHEWKRSAPPGQPMRSYFTVPAGASAQLWFKGRNDAVALCTPCRGDATAAQSFEWYEPGFRKGELKLLKCGAAR